MSTRIISQSEAVFVSTGPNASGYMLSSGGLSGINSVLQLQRIQSASYGANINRTPIFQFGQLAEIDRIILNSPTVTMNLDYIVADTYNANTLGFTTDGTAGMLSGILTKTEDEKNYFVETVKQGSDVLGNIDPDATKFTLGIGNGFISNFQARGAVGQFATEQVTVEALNYVSYTGTSGLSPAIVPSGGIRVTYPNQFILPSGLSGYVSAVSAIRPGDINLNLTVPFGPSVSDLKIQSYDLSVPIARQALNKLGSYFPFAREINFPVNVTLSVEAEMGDLQTGDLSTLTCNDPLQNITINLSTPQCGGGGPIAVQYKLLGARLENQQIQSAIGQNKRVSLQYVTTIGGPTDVTHNVFVSGAF